MCAAKSERTGLTIDLFSHSPQRRELQHLRSVLDSCLISLADELWESTLSALGKNELSEPLHSHKELRILL